MPSMNLTGLSLQVLASPASPHHTTPLVHLLISIEHEVHNAALSMEHVSLNPTSTSYYHTGAADTSDN